MVSRSFRRDALRFTARAFGLAVALSCAQLELGAQDLGGRCQNIELVNRTDSTRVAGSQLPDGSSVTNISRGIIVLCPSGGIRLVADSAEYHHAAEVIYLVGRVRYTEASTSVDARRITYWKRDERILAEGDVVARLENGTTMRGPRADYLRAVPGLRPRAQLRATERPHITLVQTDTTGSAGQTPGVRPGATASARTDSTAVDANTVFMDGDSLVYASGRVVVTRSDLVATSDSLALDRATERARFIGKPIMKGTGERAFTMSGGVIDIFSRDRKLERVLSRVGAKVVSEEITLSADTVDLRVREDLLERAYAYGPSRARAISPTQDMTADSIEIYMPGQRVREVRAVGKALAESAPDSLRIASTERDWIRGDTIIASFDSIARGDTSAKARIRELRSLVSATSFYQIPPDDTTSRCPKINYSRGDRITIAFDSQTVQRVSVVRDSGDADGLYLECQAPSADAAGTIGPAAPGAPGSTPPPPGRPSPAAPVVPPPISGRPLE